MTSHIKRNYKIQTWEDWLKACDAAEVTPAERRLMEACENGVSCTVGNGKRPDAPTPDNEIGADLLRYLIKGGCGHEACKLHEWGVDLRGAYISGALDLRNLDAAGVTGILRSTLAEPIDAMNARFNMLALNGSACKGLNAQGADVKGSVFLRDGFSAKGEVRLSSAQIGGQLECDGGSFANEGGHALIAQGAEVRGSVHLTKGFSAKGEVRLSSAQIGGQLECDGGSFANEGGHALIAQDAEVKGGVFLNNGFSAKGEVSLSSAQIGGQLECGGGSFENEGADALNAQGMEVRGPVFLSKRFFAKGEVSLAGAHIGGQLACNDGGFENEGGDALIAQGAEVKGDVFLTSGFFKGEVKLMGAQIGGQIVCSGGNFENEGGDALNAQGAGMAAFLWREVGLCSGDIVLSESKADTLVDDSQSWAKASQVYLDGFEYKTIHGPLDATTRLEWLAKAVSYDGSFSPQPYEQLARVLKTMGHDEQRRSISVDKERRQRRSERSDLRFRRRFARLVARFSKKPSSDRFREVEDSLKIMPAAEKGYVDRLGERLKLFHFSWPEQQKDVLSETDVKRAQAGFREEIFSQNLRIRTRLAWLHMKDHTARLLVGYGYRPFNFIRALVLLMAIGWLLAHQAWERGDFAPNSDVILSTKEWQTLAEGDVTNPAKAWSDKTGKGRDYETFSSIAYAADIVIPIISFGQESAWAPSTNRGPWGKTLWWLRWVLTVLGWIVTAVGAAAITGIIRRE